MIQLIHVQPRTSQTCYCSISCGIPHERSTVHILKLILIDQSDSSHCTYLCMSGSVWPDWAIFESSWQQNIYQKSPNDWQQLFGLFWKTSLLSKNCIGYFLGNFWKNWASFSPTSGHTGQDLSSTKRGSLHRCNA